MILYSHCPLEPQGEEKEMFGKDKHIPKPCRALQGAPKLIEEGKLVEALWIITEHDNSNCHDENCARTLMASAKAYKEQPRRPVQAQTLHNARWIVVDRFIQLGNFSDDVRNMLDQLLMESPDYGLECAIRANVTVCRFIMGRGQYNIATIAASRSLVEIENISPDKRHHDLYRWTLMWYIIAHSYAETGAEDLHERYEQYCSMKPPQASWMAVTAVLYGERPPIQELLSLHPC